MFFVNIICPYSFRMNGMTNQLGKSLATTNQGKRKMILAWYSQLS